MKTMSRRAWVLYALVLAFLAGLCILFYTFYTNADDWAMKKANRHLYTSGTLTTAGTIILRKAAGTGRLRNTSSLAKSALVRIPFHPHFPPYTALHGSRKSGAVPWH